MSAKILHKLLKKPKIAALIEHLSQNPNEPLAISDQNGQLLLGRTGKVPGIRYPVKFSDTTIGWVEGENGVDHIAGILSHLVEMEGEKKSLVREVLSGYKELNLFYSISQKMNECLDFKDVANLALKEACKLIKSEKASVLLFNESSASFDKLAYVGKASLKKVNLQAGIGIGGDIFVKGEPELINDVEKDPRYVPGKSKHSALICVPLKVDGKTIGLINISALPDKTFDAQDLKLAIAVATHACSCMEIVTLHERRLEQDRLKSHLERYVSSHVVDGIMESQDHDPLKPARRDVSVLFSDIRNFTQMCESLPADEMAKYLNTYFSSMVDVIFEQGGTLDKFVGDEILTFFNAPKKSKEHERKTVETAILMQQKIHSISDPWIRENFRIGMGINSGMTIVGNIGSPKHCDYTVIGDTVNIGARLQAMAKGGQILVSSSIYEATKEYFCYHRIGTFPLKGKKEHIEVFEVEYKRD
ncbi:MAG: adenylate cyclase [Chlamydiales bacterium]